MQKLFQKILLILFAMAIGCGSTAIAGTIDLNNKNFYADPSVTFAADGSSALIGEDALLGTVLLSNDPYFGDPILPFPSDPFQLSFTYEFIVGAGNWDDFYVKLFDADTGILIKDMLVEFDNASGTTFWADSATITWNISAGAPATGFGLEFQLNAWDLDADSSVLVNNVTFESVPVPVPSTFILLGLGLFGLAGIGRKKIHS